MGIRKEAVQCGLCWGCCCTDKLAASWLCDRSRDRHGKERHHISFRGDHIPSNVGLFFWVCVPWFWTHGSCLCILAHDSVCTTEVCSLVYPWITLLHDELLVHLSAINAWHTLGI